ncbi:MAG TPA: uroporphyrinogen-III synthase [Longimicrobiales bacterium]
MKTLQGVRIAVTRAAKQSSELVRRLEAAGAQVLVCPLITIEPRRLDADLHRMLDRLTDYDWIVLTSVNGVEQFIKLVRANLPNSADVLGERRFACVGPATAQALAGYGLPTHAMPDEFVGERVAAAMRAADDLTDKVILIPRAAGGGAELPAALRKYGARVEDVELYRSMRDPVGTEELRQAITAQSVDLVTFTSGSAVTYFVETVGPIRDPLIAVIGPSTADVARSLGLHVAIQADPHTIDGLVDSIIEYYAAGRGITEA